MILRQLTIQSSFWSPRLRLQTHIPASHLLHINPFGPARVQYFRHKLLSLALAIIIIAVFGLPNKADSNTELSKDVSEMISLSSPIQQADMLKTYVLNNAKSGTITPEDAQALSSSLLHWGPVFDIPPEYLLGLGVQESHFEKNAISTSNALGIFQIIPKFHFEDIELAKAATGKENIFDMEMQAYLVCKIIDRYRTLSGGSLDKALLRYYGSDSDSDNKTYQREVIQQRNRAKSFLTI